MAGPPTHAPMHTPAGTAAAHPPVARQRCLPARPSPLLLLALGPSHLSSGLLSQPSPRTRPGWLAQATAPLASRSPALQHPALASAVHVAQCACLPSPPRCLHPRCPVLAHTHTHTPLPPTPASRSPPPRTCGWRTTASLPCPARHRGASPQAAAASLAATGDRAALRRYAAAVLAGCVALRAGGNAADEAQAPCRVVPWPLPALAAGSPAPAAVPASSPV